METKIDPQELEDATGRFAGLLGEVADDHIAAGELALAGRLLALRAVVDREYAAYGGEYVKIHDPFARPAVPAAAPPAAKHRHDYRDAHGAEADVCLNCGKPRAPNGRKRRQQLIQAAPAASAGAPGMVSK